MRVNPTFTGFDEFASSGDKTEPSAGLKASGYLPLEILPAQHFNWLMNRASKGVGESQTYIDNINKELNSVLTQEGLSPDNSTNQLLAALNAGFRDTKINGTSDLNNISVTGSYQFSASTTNAPSTSAGLLFHIQWPAANAAIQLAFGVVASTSWIRGRTSGVWGSWFKLWNENNDDTLVQTSGNQTIAGNKTLSGITTLSGGSVIEVRTSDPSTPAVGRIWLRSDL